MDILQVLEGATYIAFIAGAVFAVWELREYKNERRVALFLQASEHITSKDFETALCKIWRSTINDPKELEQQVSYENLSIVLDYYQSLANMVEEGVIDRKTALRLFPFDIIWKKTSSWIAYERQTTGLPRMYGTIEEYARLQDPNLFQK